MENAIKFSVGREGKNSSSDVKLIQKLLNDNFLKTGKLKVDGVIGPKTILMIEQYQRDVLKMQRPDGLIAPGGKTWKSLNAAGTSLISLEPSDGYYSYEPSERQYGSVETIRSLKKLGALSVASLKVKIGIGDLSFSDGRLMNPHLSHRRGIDVDMRPIRLDGKALPIAYTHAQYDRPRTLKLIECLRQDPNLSMIIFNDPKIVGLVTAGGHDNHLHLRFKS